MESLPQGRCVQGLDVRETTPALVNLQQNLFPHSSPVRAGVLQY